MKTKYKKRYVLGVGAPDYDKKTRSLQIKRYVKRHDEFEEIELRLPLWSSFDSLSRMEPKYRLVLERVDK